MNKFTIGITGVVICILAGCSLEEGDFSNTTINYNPVKSASNIKAPIEASEKSAAEELRELANQQFSVKENQVIDEDYDLIVDFGKAFVNLYSGAVAEQERVSFKNYITNENLLTFTYRMLELEQQQEMSGGIGVIYGMDNEFKEAELKKLDKDLYYLLLPFSNQGSGRSCKLLVQFEDATLNIADFYFGSKDGVDTFSTGHPEERESGDPELWNDPKWVESVFDKLEKYESERKP